MDAAEFSKYLDSDNRPDPIFSPAIQELLEKYPFSSLLQMLYAKILKMSENPGADRQLEKTAVYCNDRKKLFRYMNDIREEVVVQQFVQVYDLKMTEGEMQENIGKQNDLISKFINERPFFIAKKEFNDEPEESAYDPEIVSETLAEIYLKQGKTDMALNTYEKLCLKIPEKRSYFAARIEKIKKENI